MRDLVVAARGSRDGGSGLKRRRQISGTLKTATTKNQINSGNPEFPVVPKA
jgi:hypothetical protein